MSKRDASSRDSDSDDVELTPVTFVTTSRDDDAKAEPSTQPTANPLRRPTTSATTPPAPLVVVSSEQLFGDHFRHENGIVERFHVDTFLWEALTHFWFPFSLPVLLAFDGLVGCQNKLFLPRWGRAPEGTPKEMSGAANLFNVMTSWYFAITQLLPVVFAAIFAPWSLSVAIMAFGFNIFRVLTIGGKYACFPTDQYQRFIETPYCDVSKNLLIVTWYLDIPKHTIEEQIADAENFSGIQLDALPPLTLQGGMTITARQYFEQLIDATFGQRPPAVVNFLVETLARVFILMPIIALVVHYTRDELHTLFTDGGQMASREWASFVSCGLTTVALISMAPACAKFMYVAVLHHWRSYNVQQALLRAVVRSISAQKVDDFMIPIDLGTNLIVWDRLRVVARNFGRIYANRISFNTLAMVLVTLVSLLKLVFEVVVLGSSLIEPTTVVITAFIVTLFVFTCIMAFFGILYPVLVNGTDVEVVELLAHEELALFFKLGAPMKNNAVSDAVVDQLTLAQQDSLSHLAAHAASFYTNQRKFDPTRHLYRLKSMRASVEQRQRVDATEVMFIKATTKVLTAYLAYVGSACTVIIGFLIRDGRTL